MAKLSVNEYVEVVRRSGLVEGPKLEKVLASLPNNGSTETIEVAQKLIDAKLITPWQNDKLMQGKHSGFVLGKYKLLSHISSGGMSSVYLAEHVLMQRRVAVKVLPPARLDDSSFRERFHLECQVMAALDHPNIVRAHDFDVDGKLHYLVMEYIDGPDLEGVVRKQGPLPFELAANYARQAADGLGHAHDAGLIHRDMKPANLLVDQRGCIKVLDLGVARITGANDSTSLTLAHKEDVVGTADFLAPEQAINSHNVDFRADIYALGGTFYYMLTGHGPFPDGTMAQKLLAHQTQEPSPISKERPDCPPGLAAILLRMMAKKLKARYQTMREVSDDLGRWLADTSYVPAKPGKAAAAPKPVAAAVEEPLALEERDRESVDFPLNNLTNVRPSAGGADPGPLNSGEDEADGYGLVDLDDSVDDDQANLYGDNADGEEPDPEEDLAEEPPPAEDNDDSSQEVMATKQTDKKKGDGFWDDVLNQIDEPAKDKSKSPAAKAPDPVKPEVKKPEPKTPERPKPVETLKPIERPKSPEKSEKPDKPKTPEKPFAQKGDSEKPFSPKSSALVPAGKRDVATVGKKDEKSSGSKSEKDKPKSLEKVLEKALDKSADKGPKSKRKVVLDSCPACSADLNESSPICPKCGFNTVTGAKSDGPMKPMARPKMDDDEEKDNLKVLKNPYVLGGVAILAIILIVALVMMSGGSPPTTQIDPNLLPPLPPKPQVNPPVPPPGGTGKQPNPNPNPNPNIPPDGTGKQPDPNPKPPDPTVAGHKRPASLDKWGEEDFYWAASTGDSELFDALKLLVSARKGDAEIESMLVKLLEPSKLVTAPAGQAPLPAIPLTEKVVQLLTESFITGGPTGKQAIKNILDGKLSVKNDETYLDAALAAMMAHPNPEWNQLIIESYFTPEKHRPAQFPEGVNADGLRRKVMLQFGKTNVQIRTEFGKRLNDRTLAPAVVTELLAKLSETSPANVPAQVELFLGAKLTPVQDEAFQNNFIAYGQTALDILMAGKALTEGSPAMTAEEAQAIAMALWQERVTKAVWDRFRAISDASKEKEQRNLLKLSSQLPINSARAEMAGLIERFWKNLDPVGWAENNADFGSGWGDPALWVSVKTGPERVLSTNRNAPPKIENKWFNASRQYLKVLNQRFHAAALARPSDPSLEAKRPIKPHDGAKVTAEFRMEWPQDLAGKVPGVGPLVVHYIRVEERGNLQDLDRNHYYKALVPFPKRRALQQIAGVEDSRWLDGIREADGKIYTMDVLFTRLRPMGVPSGDEDLVIEILQMEIPK